jgi:hypothetical protein
MNLIERVCKCGCEKTFKCLETSGQLYLSKLHIYAQSRKESDSYAAKSRRGVTYQEQWEYKRITRPESKTKQKDDEQLDVVAYSLQ